MSPRPSTRSTIARLLVFARPEAGALAWGTVFLAVGSALMLVFPQTVRKTLDEALQHGDTRMVDRMGLAMLGILAVRTGRLGPGIFAHLTFNAATVFTLLYRAHLL